MRAASSHKRNTCIDAALRFSFGHFVALKPTTSHQNTDGIIVQHVLVVSYLLAAMSSFEFCDLILSEEVILPALNLDELERVDVLEIQ